MRVDLRATRDGARERIDEEYRGRSRPSSAARGTRISHPAHPVRRILHILQLVRSANLVRRAFGCRERRTSNTKHRISSGAEVPGCAPTTMLPLGS